MMFERFRNDISEAEMVLVGLGEEFDDYGIQGCEESPLLDLLVQSGYGWFAPFYRDYLREKYGCKDKLVQALKQLKALLKDKNYFVVSQSTSQAIVCTEWKSGRLVMSCGSTAKKQCGQTIKESDFSKGDCSSSDVECHTCMEQSSGEECHTCWEITAEEKAKLHHISEELYTLLQEEVLSLKNSQLQWDLLPAEVAEAMKMISLQQISDQAGQKLQPVLEGCLGICDVCNSYYVLNNADAKAFEEQGYLKDWERYTKWLQGTMNRKTVLVELGVGLTRGDIIRNPFERIALLNQKSYLYRVHENLSQIPDKLAQKGTGILENAIDWLTDLC